MLVIKDKRQIVSMTLKIVVLLCLDLPNHVILVGLMKHGFVSLCLFLNILNGRKKKEKVKVQVTEVRIAQW